MPRGKKKEKKKRREKRKDPTEREFSTI